MRRELLTFALVSLVLSVLPADARGGHGGGHSMARTGGGVARGGGMARSGGPRGSRFAGPGGAGNRGSFSNGGGVGNRSGFAGGNGFAGRSGNGFAGRNRFAGGANAFSGGNSGGIASQSGNSIKPSQFNNEAKKMYAGNNGNTTNNVYANGTVNASASGYPAQSSYPTTGATTYPTTTAYPATTYPPAYPAANPYAAGAAAGWAASQYKNASQPSYGYGYIPPLPPITINAPTTTSQAPSNPEPTQQQTQSSDLANTAEKARVFARNFAGEVQAMRAQQMARYGSMQMPPQMVPYPMPQNPQQPNR